jgi:hypothetical protein
MNVQYLRQTVDALPAATPQRGFVRIEPEAAFEIGTS